MPNGGSDCCATCWFNSENGGEFVQLRDALSKGPSTEIRCVIRDLTIKVTLGTYCANHPGHNPDRIDVPVGPIYEDVGGGPQGGVLHPYVRGAMQPSPDTPAVRARLVELLEAMPETPLSEYPSGTRFDHEVIKQLGEFRERQAVPGLRRVIRFDPLVRGPGKFAGDRRWTVGHALLALATIIGGETLDECRRILDVSRPPAKPRSKISRFRRWFRSDRKDDADPLAPLRYYAVRALEHCRSTEALELLKTCAADPHTEVSLLAEQILAKRM